MPENTVKLEDYIPKRDTQQHKLLKIYPKYDGRGLLIAILDNGIDVSLPGLQKTSTGLPKIFDCFDFTGNGTVDTSTVRKVDEKNILLGLSGRKLKIPLSWKNPSGKWHLGCVSLYELCFGKEKKDEKQVDEDELIFVKKNDAAIMLSENTVLDCIVWFDGEKWQACCNTSFEGNLVDTKVLTNYRDEHQYDFLLDDISYCVSISDDGNLLEIVACTKFHGTLVAHTAAAYFPEEPERNGLAPGAQIVSMNVMTSYENYYDSIKKALLKCIELKVNIVNMCITMREGHEELIKEMVEKHGIIFVKSAGNTGPGYLTIASFEHTYNNDMFFIGSVLTTEMKQKFYNSQQTTNESPTVCLYSSKGPLLCGSRGVTFTAPGGVIVSLPKWSIKENQLCLGTSFACPIVAGSIACLLSALKGNSIKYTPNEIRMALSNTAKLPDWEDRLQFGYGIIQIYSAFKYCYRTFATKNLPKQLIKLSLNDNADKSGIFYVKKENSETVKEFNIKMSSPKPNFNSWMLEVESENAETWIQHSDITKMDSFNVKIDTNFLQPGSLNYTEIHGYDSADPLIGSQFHLPITVICPEEFTIFNNFKIKRKIILTSRIPYRLFMVPPETRRKCVIKITALQAISTELYVSYSLKRKSKILPFTCRGQIQQCTFLLDMSEFCEINICHSNLSNGERSPKQLKFNLEISMIKLPQSEENIEEDISPQNSESQTTPISSFLLI